ncbi:UbiH/UbiF/VisC/COQ6 family ubiquinone biosynthesis hydroxylase [Solimonas sp. SE-A11]|uniref:UbiH/UbiF/VisC/COQ6 family ubiquinone biosynthesis hydroxylase n=1 Tax=Solimonas sp. SE-A11 TaxID=3054954 RepID=UPI00259CDF57|nr:UbiH/UbiF/VisC/COQ6 family ubiquinone biosynthesis hydroxylase [Solimonas sp. SE-A11]MDM4769333.1 UbiH/UbiF/VisC/COQ6 family ubiquinone biosynthesis hydroxylase [Solimonas sp. SE-A11]
MRHDIIVAGAGLVGCAIVRALQQAGFDAALVERGNAPRPFDPAMDDLRVYALSPASIRWLQALGVWQQAEGWREGPYQAMKVWSEEPSRALGFDAADLRLPALGSIVENQLLQWALWSRLDPARLHTGAPVEELALDQQGAQLRLADGRRLECRLLVAADGVDSRLRGMAGIDTIGWSYEQRAIVAHVQTAKPHGQVALQRFLKTGPLAFLPLGDGRSSIVWSSTEAERLLGLDDAAFLTELAGAIQYERGALTGTTARASFPLRLNHARDYVRDSFALAGDAAHSVHPLAGQGVNLGFSDAAALVSVLTETRDAGRDYGSLRCLKRYERARKAANLDMLAVTDGLARAFDLDLPGWAPLRDLGMQAVQRLQPLKTLLARQAAGL